MANLKSCIPMLSFLQEQMSKYRTLQHHLSLKAHFYRSTISIRMRLRIWNKSDKNYHDWFKNFQNQNKEPQTLFLDLTLLLI